MESLTQTKGARTRERIVAVAAPLFNQRGFEGTSMQDIMEATGLEKGGLYRHFSSKEELAAEALQYALGLSIKTRTSDLMSIEGTLPRLRAAVARFIEIPSPIPGGCPLMNTAIDADDGNPTLRAIARKAIRSWQRRLCALLIEGIRSGEIRRDANPRQIANTLIATLEGAQMISRIEGSKQALRDAQCSLNTLLNTLAAPTTATRRRAALSHPRHAAN